jgi:O-antigen/teichoic acid export membrane protein
VSLRAHQRFGRFNALLVLAAALALAAMVLGAVLAGVRGVFIGQLAALAFTCGMALYLGGFPTRFPIHAAFLRRIFVAGVPFAVINLLGYNLINVDQLMIVAMLTDEALGLYMPVLYVGSALALFPNAIVIAMGPRLIRRFGESGTMDSIHGLTWRPVKGLSLVMPVLCAFSWVAGPLAIEWLLPEYTSAIGPLRVYIVGVFFLGLNMGTGSTLFALNKHKFDIPVVLGSIALNVVLDLVFVGWWGMGLTGIALGSVFTYLAYWIAHTALVHHYFGHGMRRSLRLDFLSGWPGLALAVVDVVAWATGRLDDPLVVSGVLLLAAFVAVSAVRMQRLGGRRSVRHV